MSVVWDQETPLTLSSPVFLLQNKLTIGFRHILQKTAFPVPARGLIIQKLIAPHHHTFPFKEDDQT